MRGTSIPWNLKLCPRFGICTVMEMKAILVENPMSILLAMWKDKNFRYRIQMGTAILKDSKQAPKKNI
jgi:hypothetical protein